MLINFNKLNDKATFLLNYFFIKCLILTKGLPQELDPFLEKLFETPECESFISDSSFLAVSTFECSPFHCNFPFQLCMRPSSQYQDETANNCRELPEKCLIAANGGIPIENKLITKQSIILNNITTTSTMSTISPNQQIINSINKSQIQIRPSIEGEKTKIFPYLSICEQLPAEGYFCGFSLKFAFNRETRTCDQFWFPGCRKEGNINSDNLFDNFDECMKAIQYCIKDLLPVVKQKPVPNEVRGNSLPNMPIENRGINSFNGQPPPPSIQTVNNGVETPFGQAGQFIRLITNTIREFRERGNNGGNEGSQKGIRIDPNQLGSFLQSLGGR